MHYKNKYAPQVKICNYSYSLDLKRLNVFKNIYLSWVMQALFTSGVKMHFCQSDHKWMSLNTDVNGVWNILSGGWKCIWPDCFCRGQTHSESHRRHNWTTWSKLAGQDKFCRLKLRLINIYDLLIQTQSHRFLQVSGNKQSSLYSFTSSFFLI